MKKIKKETTKKTISASFEEKYLAEEHYSEDAALPVKTDDADYPFDEPEESPSTEQKPVHDNENFSGE